VRDLYPTEQPSRIRSRVTDAFLRSLVAQVTSGFGGKVAVAPRLFLRELTDVLDRVDQHQDFDPTAHYSFEIPDAKLTPEELAAARGTPEGESPESDGAGDEDEPVEPQGARRLDG
jgi:hypothetical protein